jgi:hypothetical protein
MRRDDDCSLGDIRATTIIELMNGRNVDGLETQRTATASMQPSRRAARRCCSAIGMPLRTSLAKTCRYEFSILRFAPSVD